jgi:hypothetical protein
VEAPDFETFRVALGASGFHEAESRYDETALGSWIVVVDDPPARVVWDGRERWLVLQEQTAEGWADVWLARAESDQTTDAVTEQLVLLRAANRTGADARWRYRRSVARWPPL